MGSLGKLINVIINVIVNPGKIGHRGPVPHVVMAIGKRINGGLLGISGQKAGEITGRIIRIRGRHPIGIP